jgi:hypothetical protein
MADYLEYLIVLSVSVIVFTMWPFKNTDLYERAVTAEGSKLREASGGDDEEQAKQAQHMHVLFH